MLAVNVPEDLLFRDARRKSGNLETSGSTILNGLLHALLHAKVAAEMGVNEARKGRQRVPVLFSSPIYAAVPLDEASVARGALGCDKEYVHVLAFARRLNCHSLNYTTADVGEYIR